MGRSDSKEWEDLTPKSEVLTRKKLEELTKKWERVTQKIRRVDLEKREELIRKNGNF